MYMILVPFGSFLGVLGSFWEDSDGLLLEFVGWLKNFIFWGRRKGRMWRDSGVSTDSFYQVRPECTDVPKTKFKIRVRPWFFRFFIFLLSAFRLHFCYICFWYVACLVIRNLNEIIGKFVCPRVILVFLELLFMYNVFCRSSMIIKIILGIGALGW